MTIKTATSRLFVTLISLLTTVLALAASLVRLTVTLVTGLTAGLEALIGLLPKRGAQTSKGEALRTTRPNLRIVPQDDNAAKITFALIGMGFQVPRVKAAVSSLGPTVDTNRIEDSIKVCLRSLSTKAA